MNSKPNPSAAVMHLSEKLRQKRSNNAGIAIITVLSVLLLMSVLVLAFFSLAANEYTASTNYEYTIRSRQAADTAISMVIAQIRKATTQKNVGSAKGYQSWASQPGAITTFKTDTGYMDYKEAAQTKFKLYSSDAMETFGDYNCAEDVPGDWIDRPDIYIDLNEPVVQTEGDDLRLHFPIVDPRASIAVWSDSDGIRRRQGPEGFAYTDESSAGERIDGVTFANGAEDTNARLPMPVRWIYMLDDGTLGYLSDQGKFVRTYGEGNPSKENPMAYRFGFWTDDETSKLNINTASEGNYWDLPRGMFDTEMGKFQPQENEFQRFPGQPSFTSLSPVFAPGQDTNRQIEEAIYELAPKIQPGGTEGGTRKGTRVTLDEHRLFPSVEEYLYDPVTRKESDSYNRIAEKGDLERARFLLTANSRAPELTLFGTPRISMWSMFSDQKDRTPFDKTIAYCSTLPRDSANGSGGTQYYFLRSKAGWRHGENYVNSGGHNRKLLEDYLYPMIDFNNPIPGIGGSLGLKFGPGKYGDAQQIGTQMIDYLRNVNLADPRSAGYWEGNSSIGQVAPMCMCGGTGPHQTRWANAAQPYPKGFGRHYTLSEVALVFMVSGIWDDATGRKGDTKGLQENEMRLQVGIVMETFCASHGFLGILPNTTFQVVNGNIPLRPNSNTVGPDNMPEINIVGSKSLAKNDLLPIPSDLTAVGNNAAVMPGRRVWGGTGGVRLLSSASTQGGITFRMRNDNGSISDGHIIVSSKASQLDLEETTLRVIVYDAKDRTDVNSLIQVFDCKFPRTSMPVPNYTNNGTDTWQKRIQKARNKADGENDLIMGGKNETVRSVVVSHGDYRVVAAKRVIVPDRSNDTKSHMQPHPDYDSQATHAHSLVMADGTPVNGASHGSLVQGAGYPKQLTPDFPMDASEADFARTVDASYPFRSYLNPSNSGDWDNGLGIQPDGSYINRADDGRAGNDAYFGTLDRIGSQAAKNFTPNRLVYGPGMYGSLSSGVQANIPWRTLLFRPDPMHFGAVHKNILRGSVMDPPDHLFMDLFWMPVVEPYPISEPFSTAGKVNLNYQIAPFDYIKRRTALHGIFAGERMMAIPTSAGSYKLSNNDYRKKIDANETLKQFEDRFNDGEIFRSATEICEVYLVPEGQKLGTRSTTTTPTGNSVYDYKSMRSFWASHKLTGDNLKERPYASIYPRVTTKSNTYKMHMTVQSLKKARSTADDIWDPDRDRVTSQWRGSAVIERSVDPNDPDIPDYSVQNFTNLPNVEVFYNYRVLNVKQFSP